MKKWIKSWIFLSLIFSAACTLTNSCKKDDDQSSPETVTDIDGNVYHTVTIGTQVWMVENLKTTRYRNGDPIPNITDNAQWGTLATGAWCNFLNDPALGDKYGKLYNWFVVGDFRGIAPVGWRVATENDWAKLYNYVSLNLAGAGSLSKALAAKVGWPPSSFVFEPGNDPTKNDIFGFSALPAGIRTSGIGIYDGLEVRCDWWCSNSKNDDDAMLFGFRNDAIRIENFPVFKTAGLSVRCIKY